MKVLKNNYKPVIAPQIETNSYPRKILCECCGSELEYEKEDIRIGAFGCAYIDCPLCDSDNALYDGDCELTLTKDNVEFPAHFWHTCVERGAVDCCNNEEVKRAIHKAILYFRMNKYETHWSTESGNLYVGVTKYYGDESYEVVVTKDYYETSIPFEKEDY